jgi:anti-sigma regulatory factor (Ser/Thr protein kinase)
VRQTPPVSSNQSRDQVVSLGFPPSSRFLSAARLVATSLGADAGLTVDDLDDLRLGVNELVTTLVDTADGTSRIALEFITEDSSITVSGRVDGPTRDLEPDELSARILAAVADRYELGPSSFVLTKRSTLREHA